jgi:hypothetical protein
MSATLAIGDSAGLTVINDGVSYWSLSDTGMGTPDVQRLAQAGPNQHGETDMGFRLKARQLQLILLWQSADESAYWQMRDSTMALFAPRSYARWLRLTRPDGAIRQIDVHPTGALDFPSQQRVGAATQQIAVTLAAPDPTWYDPTEVVANFGIAGGSGAFTVPMPVAFGVGAAVVNQTTVITYPGTWQANPVIQIIGPIINPVITNNTTGETLNITANITVGQTWTIDTRYGRKSVTDQAGVNQIGTLSDASNLATFHLASITDVPNGDNSLTVTGTNATAATIIYLRYYTRYLGA